jgi:hypothetical protein
MRTIRAVRVAFVLLVIAASAVVTVPAGADLSDQSLPFSQDWSDTGLITVSDDWSGVAGVIGYRGDDLTTSTGTDPQTLVVDGSGTAVDVNANQSNPDTFATGGVAEFHVANPTVALNGSGTADAPHLVVSLATTGFESVSFSYTARDLDGSADNAIQPVATQYRIGTTGNFTNLPAAFVADATAGPSLAGMATPVSVVLPADADNQPAVQVRVITTNAVGNGEWVGIDDIAVIGTPISGDSAPAVSATNPANGATDVALDANLSVTFNEPVTVTDPWFDISCTTSGDVAATVSGGPTTFVLDPTVDLANGETCTVTLTAGAIVDQDVDDPPDNPNADSVFSFTTVAAPTTIAEIQGAAHVSPLEGQSVNGVEGIVTARRTAGGRGFWIEDPTPDADPATSDAVFVFLNAAPAAQVGDLVRVSSTVSEFRPGGDPDNLEPV